MQPAEEDIAGGLHQALPGDHALAVVFEDSLGAEVSPRVPKPRPPSSAGIGGLAVPAKQQRDPCACANTPDTDYLPSEIGLA